jgi:hypothetical protein
MTSRARSSDKRQEADVVLANLHPHVRAGFEATRLLELVRHFPTVEDALAYFEKGEPPVGLSSLTIGARYTRPELVKRWGYESHQAIRRGVVTPHPSACGLL